MKPIQSFDFKDTAYEIEYLDGIMVSSSLNECTSKELDLYRLEGTQEDGKYALSRPFLAKDSSYFYKDILILDLKLHRMISVQKDMSDWMWVSSKPISTLIGTL